MKNAIFMLMLFVSYAIILGGCASGPKAYQDLDSSAKLQPAQNYHNTLLYRMPGLEGKKYAKFIIDPVQIYSGEDAQFGSVSKEDRQIVAGFIRDEFTRVLKDRYTVVTQPGPGVLRLKFTLAGLELTKTALATVTHVIPVGLVLNIGKSAAGMPGSFMGSVTLAGELYDGETNTLVFAFVTKKSPNAMNVTTMLSGLDAAKKAITEVAEKFVEEVDKTRKGEK